MNASLIFKVSIIWIVIAIFAVGNGIFREIILVPNIGHDPALPISGIILSLVIFLITYLFFPFLGKHDFKTYLLIGFQWVIITILFEFIFGHYVVGKSWSTIFQVFNIMKGDLFVLVLLASLLSPLLVAKLKKQ